MQTRATALVYIGQPRFRSVSAANHAAVIDRMRRITDINIYDFTSSDDSRSPWRESGGYQVTDWMLACRHTTESTIVKFRTDLWFTPTAASALVTEFSALVQGSREAVFMGSNWARYLGHTHTRCSMHEQDFAQDFVVMAHRDQLAEEQVLRDRINGTSAKKRQNGTMTWRHILADDRSAVNVFCQIYLVRQHYDDPDPYRVGRDYITAYRKQWKMPDALPWYEEHWHEV
jgi:hypothetical protein